MAFAAAARHAPRQAAARPSLSWRPWSAPQSACQGARLRCFASEESSLQKIQRKVSDALTSTPRPVPRVPRASSESGNSSVIESLTQKTDARAAKARFWFRESFVQAKPKVVGALVAGGVVVGGFIVLKLGWKIISTLSHISFVEVGVAAYVVGILSAFAFSSLVGSASRLLALRPEPAYLHTLKRISHDPSVLRMVGPTTPGKFRAYSYVVPTVTSQASAERKSHAAATAASEAGEDKESNAPGGQQQHQQQQAKRWEQPTTAARGGASPTPTVATGGAATGAEATKKSPTWWSWMPGSIKRMIWRPRRLQMMFQVSGTQGRSAMVAAEVEKARRSFRFVQLEVTSLQDGERVVLEGLPDSDIFQGHTRLR